jgi:hypothetical protein
MLSGRELKFEANPLAMIFRSRILSSDKDGTMNGGAAYEVMLAGRQ